MSLPCFLQAALPLDLCIVSKLPCCYSSWWACYRRSRISWNVIHKGKTNTLRPSLDTELFISWTLIRIRADPNYLDPLKWFRRQILIPAKLNSIRRKILISVKLRAKCITMINLCIRLGTWKFGVWFKAIPKHVLFGDHSQIFSLEDVLILFRESWCWSLLEIF